MFPVKNWRIRGSRRYELPWSAASSKLHVLVRLPVGVLELVLDVEEPDPGRSGEEER